MSVMPAAWHDGADCAAGDDAGARAGGQHDDPGRAKLADDPVGDGAAAER